MLCGRDASWSQASEWEPHHQLQREGYWGYYPWLLLRALSWAGTPGRGATVTFIGLSCSLATQLNGFSCLIPPHAGACCLQGWSLPNRYKIYNSKKPQIISKGVHSGFFSSVFEYRVSHVSLCSKPNWKREETGLWLYFQSTGQVGMAFKLVFHVWYHDSIHCCHGCPVKKNGTSVILPFAYNSLLPLRTILMEVYVVTMYMIPLKYQGFSVIAPLVGVSFVCFPLTCNILVSHSATIGQSKCSSSLHWF